MLWIAMNIRCNTVLTDSNRINRTIRFWAIFQKKKKKSKCCHWKYTLKLGFMSSLSFANRVRFICSKIVANICHMAKCECLKIVPTIRFHCLSNDFLKICSKNAVTVLAQMQFSTHTHFDCIEVELVPIIAIDLFRFKICWTGGLLRSTFICYIWYYRIFHKFMR